LVGKNRWFWLGLIRIEPELEPDFHSKRTGTAFLVPIMCASGIGIHIHGLKIPKVTRTTMG
jgi:hypothetical protein